MKIPLQTLFGCRRQRDNDANLKSGFLNLKSVIYLKYLLNIFRSKAPTHQIAGELRSPSQAGLHLPPPQKTTGVSQIL